MSKLKRLMNKTDLDSGEPWNKYTAEEVLTALESHTDEALWEKAKRASEHAVGRIKWPFVMWWYKEHGGK